MAIKQTLLFSIFLRIFLECFSAFGLSDVDRQELINKNILAPYNPGFENGKSSWTIGTDTISAVTSGSNLLTGKGSITWNSAGAARILASKAVTIPNGLYGSNGYAQCKIQVPSGSATHTLSVYDGTNTLVSTTVTSSTLPTFTGVNFVFPSSGTVQIRMTSVAADEPLIAIDDCYIGPAVNLSQVSQALLVGSAKIAGTTNCGSWTRTNTSLGAFASDADCPGPTVITNPGPGTIQTTDTDLPKFTVNSLPPGVYIVTIVLSGTGATSGEYYSFAVNDGTTTSPATTVQIRAANAGSVVVVKGVFTYTTTANQTFQVYGAGTAGQVTLDGSQPLSDTSFFIERFPSSSETAFNANTSPGSWSGYHNVTCDGWTRTSTSYGDFADDASSCTLTEKTNVNFGTVVTYGSAKPGITFTPKKAGRYLVMASFSGSDGTVNAIFGYRLTDGTTVLSEQQTTNVDVNENKTFILQGIYNATSTSAVTLRVEGFANGSSTNSIQCQSGTPSACLNWTLIAIDQQLPVPQLIGQVSNSGTGQVRTEVAELNCNSGSTITSQANGSNWISSIGNIASGTCAVGFTAGTFSSAPYCVVTGSTANSTPRNFSTNTATTSGINVDCIITATAADCTTEKFILNCVGAK